MLKIRLSRTGKKKQPSFRVVIQEKSAAVKGGKVVENIGYYLPAIEPKEIKINLERAKYWISVGARPSDRVAVLLKNEGVEGMEKFMEPRNKKAKKKKEVEVKEEPKAEEVKKEEPAKEEPKAEEVKKEEPVKEEPKAEEAKKEEPAKEEPKAEEVKKEEAAKEEPKAEEVKKEEAPKEEKTEESPA